MFGHTYLHLYLLYISFNICMMYVFGTLPFRDCDVLCIVPSDSFVNCGTRTGEGSSRFERVTNLAGEIVR